jgi:hypothetical protein
MDHFCRQPTSAKAVSHAVQKMNHPLILQSTCALPQIKSEFLQAEPSLRGGIGATC